MTLRQLRTLKTPVIIHERERTADTINYFRITKIVTGKLPVLYLDLQVGEAQTSKYIYLYSKPVYFPLYELPSPGHYTKVPWKRAKREMLNLLLGPSK